MQRPVVRVSRDPGQQPSDPPPLTGLAQASQIPKIALIQTIAFTRCWRTLILSRKPLSPAQVAAHCLGAAVQAPWLGLALAVRCLTVGLGVSRGQVRYRDGVIAVVSTPPNQRRRRRVVGARSRRAVALAMVAFAGGVLPFALVSWVLLGALSPGWLSFIAFASVIPGAFDVHLCSRHKVRGVTFGLSGVARTRHATAEDVRTHLRAWVPPRTSFLAYSPIAFGIYRVVWPQATAEPLDDGVAFLPRTLRPPLCLIRL